MSEPVLEVYRGLIVDDMLDYIHSIIVPQRYETIRLDRFPNLLARWLINNRCYSDDCDELLPRSYEGIDEDLDEYLAYHGVPLTVRRSLEKGLIELSEKGTEILNEIKPYVDDIDQRIIVNRDQSMTTLTPRFRLKLSENQYPTASLYNIELPESAIFGSTDHPVSIRTSIYDQLLDKLQPEDLDKFNRDLYSMLKRYETVGAVNIHNTPPPAFIDMLVESMGLNYQAFAHPLFEAGLEGYMSLYPDTDVPFGSIGTYRELKNLPGQEEIVVDVKLPFISGFMNEFLDFMEDWFSEETRPVTLILSAPTWPDAAIYNRILNSPYVVTSMVLPRDEHRYKLAGSAYRPHGPEYMNLADTTIFVIQNDRGFNTRNIPIEFDERVRESFA